MSPIKWFAAILGLAVGVTHIGMIGMVSRRNTDKNPVTLPEIGPYSSYVMDVKEDGYQISYKANDPKTMYITKDIKTKAGFLGLSSNTQKIVEEYVMDGQTNQGAPVSNARSWITPYEEFTKSNPEVSQRALACIKAQGSAEGTGRLVGTSVGAAAAPAVSSSPFVGWVAAGWIAMFGGEQGADIGGNMAKEMNKNC